MMRRMLEGTAWALIPALWLGGCALTRPNRLTNTRTIEPASAVAEPHKGAPAREPASSPSGAPLFAGAERLDRQSLVQAVLERNPNLAAARQAWRAAVARYPQASSLDDPMLEYGFAPLSIGSSKVDYGQTVDLSQRLPWPGKLRLKGEAALHEAEARLQDYQSARLELALTASLLFDDYYFIDRAIEINREHVDLLADFKDVATARYASGLLSQQDPLQAEVELAHLAHRDVSLRADRDVTVARLNALLHRSPSAALPPPPQTLPVPELQAALEALAARSPEEVEQLAVAQRPEIAAASAEIRAREASVSLAQLEGYPDFGVMGSYNSMWGEEEHRWMLGLSVNLPIWRERIRAAQAEASAELAQAESRRAGLEDDIRADVRQTLERLRESHHIVELYQSRLLPAATDQVQAARTGVETARNSFLALIEAERNLRTVKLGYQEALTDFDRRFAELDRFVGRVPGEWEGLAGTVEAEGEDR